MSDSITVTIAPEPDRVRLLAMTPTFDVLRAVLGPISGAHPRAAATLLEGLALWHQRPLSVVLSAEDADDGCGMGLCDALGFGRTLHYEVGLAFPVGAPPAAAIVVTFAASATSGTCASSRSGGPSLPT